jgi:hypothetical protein
MLVEVTATIWRLAYFVVQKSRGPGTDSTVSVIVSLSPPLFREHSEGAQTKRF